MKNHTLRNSFFLLLTAAIWGASFVAQSIGMNDVDPIIFNGMRLILGGLTLLPVMAVRLRTDPSLRQFLKKSRRVHLVGGIACGVVLFVASTVQAYGIRQTSVGKAGFITTFYIILVPLFSMLLGKKVSKVIWAAVAIAVAGLYLICINESFSVSRGDFLVFLCAFAFAAHILVIDHFTASVDGMAMSCIQFFAAGVIAVFVMIFFIHPDFHALYLVRFPLLYTGVISSGIGYTLQIVGQKGLHPAIASLLMSMESCMSVLAGFLILHQQLTSRELTGCGLMFMAIILADLLPMLGVRKKNFPADSHI